MITLAEIPQKQDLPQVATVSFKNILLATDFSDASEKAFSYAAAMARAHGSKIYIVHVISPETNSFIPELPTDRLRREAEREMRILVSRGELQLIAHDALVRAGPVCNVLSAVIRERNIDVVVLGTHGRGGLKKLVLGSVAEEVLRRANCPVITVGPHLDVSLITSGEIRNILFATDFHSASTKAFEYALLLANRFHARLILLHLLPPTALPGPGVTFYHQNAIDEWKDRVTASTKQKLEKLLPASIKLGSEPEYVLGFDFTAEGILKIAEERQADLMVMGAKRSMSAKLSAHLPGTVSYEVIRHAKCPVLTISA